MFPAINNQFTEIKDRNRRTLLKKATLYRVKNQSAMARLQLQALIFLCGVYNKLHSFTLCILVLFWIRNGQYAREGNGRDQGREKRRDLVLTVLIDDTSLRLLLIDTRLLCCIHSHIPVHSSV